MKICFNFKKINFVQLHPNFPSLRRKKIIVLLSSSFPISHYTLLHMDKHHIHILAADWGTDRCTVHHYSSFRARSESLQPTSPLRVVLNSTWLGSSFTPPTKKLVGRSVGPGLTLTVAALLSPVPTQTLEELEVPVHTERARVTSFIQKKTERLGISRERWINVKR